MFRSLVFILADVQRQRIGIDKMLNFITRIFSRKKPGMCIQCEYRTTDNRCFAYPYPKHCPFWTPVENSTSPVEPKCNQEKESVAVYEAPHDVAVRIALSMYLGEKCKFCKEEFKTLEDLKTAVWAGYHEHGRLAHESCWVTHEGKEQKDE